MADEETPEREPATTHADQFERHGKPDPSKWQEAAAVTDRPNDTPLDDPAQEYAVPNSTMADRRKAREKWEKERDAKRVDEAENKAVTSAQTKTRRKKS